MKWVFYITGILICSSCSTNTPIYYNACWKSEFVIYHNIGGMDTLIKNDPDFQLLSNYLGKTSNFTDYREPENPHPIDTYRFDFYSTNKRIKSIYIHRWREPKFYSMDDFGWNTTYNANVEETDKLLKRLEIIPEYF